MEGARQVCTWEGCEQITPVSLTPNRPLMYCNDHRSLAHSRAGSKGRNGHKPRVEDRYVTAQGYVHVRTTPFRFEPEHRVVMERMLGRPLRKGESVHHRNGHRDDNAESNLELWLGPMRNGIRASDIKCPHCGEPYATV